MRILSLALALISTTAVASQQDLMDTLNTYSSLARKESGIEVGQQVSEFESFSSLAQRRDGTNFHEPEVYIEKILNGKMTQSLWCDVVGYLNEQKKFSVSVPHTEALKLAPAVEYARSHAYNTTQPN